MALNVSKKSCIAWFKLAEFVDRKEKEKAIILYNLLSKSLNNNPFCQILLSTIYKYFDDPEEAKKNLYLTLDLIPELTIENKIAIREFLIVNTYDHQQKFIVALVQDYKIYYNNNDLIKIKLQELSKYSDQETSKILKIFIGKFNAKKTASASARAENNI